MTEESVVEESPVEESPVEEIDTTSGIYAKAKKHPFVTGGLLLVGAGAAYAIAKTLINGHSEVARDVHIETSIAINKPPEEIYSFWRDFKNLPVFMKSLESVTEIDRWNSHWVARGLGGSRVEWDAEIYNEKENELISWRSLEKADVVNAGSVRFERAPFGHGTYVRVTINYNPPAGRLGATLAQLLGAEPTQLIKADLRLLKQLLEAGEIATVAGQTSGRAEAPKNETEEPPATDEQVNTQAA
jgi:uncharacterized membrane protein